jgi:integrase
MTGSLVSAMPKKPSGSIETHEWMDGRTVTYRLRVRVDGRRHRVDLGTNHEGWSAERAQVELDRISRQIERGTWEAPARRGAVERLDRSESVHATASRWWDRRKAELRPNTRLDYQWRLDYVLSYLRNEVTAELDARAVDEFRSRLHAKGLAPRSVNMVLDLLAQVLDDAVEYGLLDANPARGRRRRMKVAKPRRNFLEPDMVVDLLDTAGAWEAGLPRHQRYGRRALLAALCLAGPRISELTAAPLGRLDIHGGRLRVGEAKTEAGLRDIELTAFLAGELRGQLAGISGSLRDRHGAALPVFHSRTGRALNASNVRNRLLAETVERANKKRAKEGRMLLPDKVTPHTLRRTFASLSLAAGRDARWVMGQMGHTDARLTLTVYAQVIQRQRVDDQLIWMLMRFSDEPESPAGSRSIDPRSDPTSTRGLESTTNTPGAGRGKPAL